MQCNKEKHDSTTAITKARLLSPKPSGYPGLDFSGGAGLSSLLSGLLFDHGSSVWASAPADAPTDVKWLTLVSPRSAWAVINW
jgi:hypothetical protein